MLSRDDRVDSDAQSVAMSCRLAAGVAAPKGVDEGMSSGEQDFSGLVSLEFEGHIATVTMTRAERRNALSIAMREMLISALNAAMDDDRCRAIVLTGAGGNFCAGGDLDDFSLGSMDDARERVRRGHVLPRMIVNGPKPVIAAVEGSAFGAGLSLAMVCDHVVAAQNSRLCASFSKVGLMPDYGLIWSLQRRVGHTNANEMLMQAIEISGREAEAIGLVNETCECGAALERARAVAGVLAARAPLTLAAIKSANASSGLETMFAQEVELQPTLFLSHDFAGAIDAFRNKRQPEFKGR